MVPPLRGDRIRLNYAQHANSPMATIPMLSHTRKLSSTYLRLKRLVNWSMFRISSRLLSSHTSVVRFLHDVSFTFSSFKLIKSMVLFLVYFPTHLRYTELEPDATPKVLKSTSQWRLAITLGIAVAAHVILLSLLSLTLLVTLPTSHPVLRHLALFLGISATLLAVLQYAPQIHKTYTSGLVGALSIGTMVIQVPGSVLFVVSLVLRPGTDWTSWLAYAVSGAMQGALLVSRTEYLKVREALTRWQVICLCWKRRQRRLGVDDFGNPLVTETTSLLQ